MNRADRQFALALIRKASRRGASLTKREASALDRITVPTLRKGAGLVAVEMSDEDVAKAARELLAAGVMALELSENRQEFRVRLPEGLEVGS